MLKCPQLAKSRKEQHGSKKKSSTIHAEFLISETIHYYNTNGSSIYICAVLTLRRLSTAATGRFYSKNYTMKKAYLYRSLTFLGLLMKRVFQGSILSPHLYYIYIEELIKCIEESCIRGTSLYGVYTGIIVYADDIVLISATINGLQNLLDKCTSYFNSTAISLNISKTEFIGSYRTRDVSPNKYIAINHHLLSPGRKLKHLGFTWNTKRSGSATLDDANVEERINTFWAAVFSLIKGGIRFCHPNSILDMYRKQLIPTLTYGLELTHMKQCEINLM